MNGVLANQTRFRVGAFGPGLLFGYQIKLLCFIDLTLIFCKEKSENGIEEFDH